MPFLKAQFNPTRTINALTARQRGFKANFEDEMDDVGRQIAVYLAAMAKPSGFGKEAQARGAIAVAQQIRRIYAVPSRVYGDLLNASKEQADAFYRAMRTGFYSGAKEIMKLAPRFAQCEIGPFDGGALHKSHRDSQGHIPKNQKPLLVVTNRVELAKYIEKEASYVGFGKAGWVNCARAFADKGATRPAPGWVTRHKTAPGGTSKRIFNNGAHIEITLRNDVKYAQNLMTASEKSTAVQRAIGGLVKSAVTAERKAAAAAPFP
jgi:hypothetical protein